MLFSLSSAKLTKIFRTEKYYSQKLAILFQKMPLWYSDVLLIGKRTKIYVQYRLFLGVFYKLA